MTVKKASQAEWKAFTEQCEQATFFHTLDWYLVWKEYIGYELETLLFQFDTRNQALLPLASLKQTKGLTKWYMSSPAGTYGGFLTFCKLTNKEKEQLRKYLKKIKWITLRENPFNQEIIINNWSENDFTQFIKIDTDLEKIVKQWNYSNRTYLRKGLENELEICQASNVKDWEAYYQVYLASLKRWGERATSQYDWDLFLLIQKIPSQNCALWLAKYQGEIIAGCLCFYYKQHLVHWHAASLASHFHLSPNHVLHYTIMEDGVSRGFRFYDFNPSGGHKGVETFKKGFGGIKKQTNILATMPLTIQWLNKMKNKFNV